MQHVATLVAGPGFGALEPLVAALARSLHGEPSWLDPGMAADIAVADTAPAEITEAVAAAVAEVPVDHAVQPAFGRRKRLLIADMDSTFITVECIDVLAARAGIGAEIAGITLRTIRGELDFGQSLRQRVARLRDTPVALLDDAWRQDVGFMPGGATLIATMRDHGALTALVSGGFTWFTGRVADALGFDLHRANLLVLDGDRLAGTLEEPVLDRGAKLTALRELALGRGLALAETLAVGDGANDLDMLRAAGLGVGYRPVELVAREADALVRHCGLEALLFFQGYERNAFVAAQPRR